MPVIVILSLVTAMVALYFASNFRQEAGRAIRGLATLFDAGTTPAFGPHDHALGPNIQAPRDSVEGSLSPRLCRHLVTMFGHAFDVADRHALARGSSPPSLGRQDSRGLDEPASGIPAYIVIKQRKTAVSGPPCRPHSGPPALAATFGQTSAFDNNLAEVDAGANSMLDNGKEAGGTDTEPKNGPVFQHLDKDMMQLRDRKSKRKRDDDDNSDKDMMQLRDRKRKRDDTNDSDSLDTEDPKDKDWTPGDD